MLDILFKIKDEKDHTLNFRRSCRCVVKRSHVKMQMKCCAFGSICILQQVQWAQGRAQGLPADAALCVHVQGGHLRQLRHEHRWRERPGMPNKGGQSSLTSLWLPSCLVHSQGTAADCARAGQPTQRNSSAAWRLRALLATVLTTSHSPTGYSEPIMLSMTATKRQQQVEWARSKASRTPAS